MLPSTPLPLRTLDNPDCSEQPVPRWLLHDLLQQLNAFGLAQEHLKDVLQPHLAADSALSASWEAMTNSIHTQDRLLRTLRQYLNVRSSAAPLGLRAVPLDFLARQVMAQFEKHPLSGKLICAGFCSRAVFTCSENLLELLSCLIENALAHSLSRVHLTAEEIPGGTRIDVIDDGTGIDPALTSVLGMPFLRVPQQASTQRGLGLGIHIAAKHAEILGHPFEVISTQGKGSRFSVTLENSANELLRSLSDERHDPIEGSHVLVLDNDLRRGKELQKLLIQWNCRSDYAGHWSDELSDSIKRGDFDLILISHQIWLNHLAELSIFRRDQAFLNIGVLIMVDNEFCSQLPAPSQATDDRHRFIRCPITPSRLRSLLTQTIGR